MHKDLDVGGANWLSSTNICPAYDLTGEICYTGTLVQYWQKSILALCSKTYRKSAILKKLQILAILTCQAKRNFVLKFECTSDLDQSFLKGEYYVFLRHMSKLSILDTFIIIPNNNNKVSMSHSVISNYNVVYMFK